MHALAHSRAAPGPRPCQLAAGHRQPSSRRAGTPLLSVTVLSLLLGRFCPRLPRVCFARSEAHGPPALVLQIWDVHSSHSSGCAITYQNSITHVSGVWETKEGELQNVDIRWHHLSLGHSGGKVGVAGKTQTKTIKTYLDIFRLENCTGLLSLGPCSEWRRSHAAASLGQGARPALI